MKKIKKDIVIIATQGYTPHSLVLYACHSSLHLASTPRLNRNVDIKDDDDGER